MCTNITDLYLLSNILYYIFEEKQILTYSVRLMYCCIHHFQQFQFFHMRRTHSGHCVGEICGGLTALGLCGIMKVW